MNDDFYCVANGLLNTWLPVRGNSFDSDTENWARTELRDEHLTLELMDGTVLPTPYFAGDDCFVHSITAEPLALDEVRAFRLSCPALALAEEGFNQNESPMGEIAQHISIPGRLTMFFLGWRNYHPQKQAIKVLHDVTTETGEVYYGMYHNGTKWRQILSESQIRDEFNVTQSDVVLLEAQVFKVRFTSYYLAHGHEEFLV
jgi:hypothetical protein